MAEDVCKACLSCTQIKDVWYIDSGASSHMTGHKLYFSSLSEKEIGFEIMLGDDYMYHPKGIGTIKCERESSKPMFSD